ncbi:MAG: hypothetical protein ABIH77_02170, partial [Pseudomonadota bacterium]
DGFLSAAAAEATPLNEIGTDFSKTSVVAERTIAAGIVGGTVASATGGSFMNGAKTATFAEMFNDTAHEMLRQQEALKSRYIKAVEAWQAKVWATNNELHNLSFSLRVSMALGLTTLFVPPLWGMSAELLGGGAVVEMENGVIEFQRVGSALKTDLYHAFPDVVDNFADESSVFQLRNGENLYQVEGSFNGVGGRFEWIEHNETITHRLFVKGGIINGIPIAP